MFPLIFSCPADHVADWQPRILPGMVEARLVNNNNNNNEKTFVGGGAHQNERRAVAKANRVWKP